MSGSEEPEVQERVEQWLPYVKRVARGFEGLLAGLVEPDDIEQHGRMGLLDAARRFDPTRGVPFKAFAMLRIRGAILDAAREAARDAGMPRRTYDKIRAAEEATRFGDGALEETFVAVGGGKPVLANRMAETMAAMATAVAVGVIAESAAVDDEPAAITRVDPEKTFAKEELMAFVKRCVDDLPRDERELVRRHYFEGERFDHIAAELGHGKFWGSRLHSRAIARLAERLKLEEM